MVVLLALTGLFVELGIRVARSIILDSGAMTVLRSSPNAIVDDEMGWSSPRSEVIQFKRACYGELIATYNEDGLRVFKPLGPKRTGELRVCVLGDSVTQAYQLTDGIPYYHVLEHELRSEGYDVRFMGAGVGGFGTLQQTMMFDRACAKHDPDMILWQFSGNDTTNNSYLIERYVGRDNNFRRRPYSENGKIVRRHPGPIKWPFDSLAMRIINGAIIRSSARPDIEKEELPRTLSETDQLIGTFRDNVDVPILGFSAVDENDLRRIIEKHSEYVGLVEFEENVEDCTAAGDQHPNSAGHAKMARFLKSPLKAFLQGMERDPGLEPD